MSEFTQEQQTEIVRYAKELTATIMYEEEEIEDLEYDSFEMMPDAPIHIKLLKNEETIKPEYPKKPKTDYSFKEYKKIYVEEQKKRWQEKSIFFKAITIVGLVLSTIASAFSIPIILYIFWYLKAFFSYSGKLNELNAELAKSPEYLAAVAEAERIAKEKQEKIDRELEEKQKKIDEEYAKEKDNYDNVIIPKYNEEKRKWERIRDMKISILQEEIRLNTEALNALYDATRIISSTYRELWILSWLYEDMSTSDHDIRYATELLDRDRQRIATIEAGDRVTQSVYAMESVMMQGFNAVYDAIEQGNELQSNAIQVLSKSRRDMNIGNLIGTTQRHNTNKMLERLLPKK